MKDVEILKQKVEELRMYFHSELTLLRGVCNSTGLIGRAKDVRIVIASAVTTGTALHQLGNMPQFFYAEMIMLGRSFIEKIANFCYLQICSEAEFEKYKLHPHYKAFHNTDKTKHAGDTKVGLKFSGREDLKKDPIVAKALKIFSDTNPRKDWSDLGIDQKVAAIKENTDLSIEFFLLNTLSVYSNASEVLHGSLYGCAFPTGAFTSNVDPANTEAIEFHVLENVALLYVQFGSMVNETIKLLSNNDVITSFSDASIINQKVALTLLKEVFQKQK